MGILNLTEDSFSDGGLYRSPAAAIAAALQMVEAGADIIDIGAESTRPGAAPVSEEQEWARLQPVLSALVAAVDRPISVDTRHPAVMVKAIEAGAAIINDIGGFRLPEARAAVAVSDVGVVSMHMQGDDPATMQAAPVYRDVCAEVGAFLMGSRQQLMAAGVAAGRICLDPGFGFGKTLAHNLAMFGGLRQWAAVAPVLVGVSRKSMLGTITGQPVDRRLAASLAAALAAVQAGADVVRVHDVAETVQALAVWSAIGLPRG
ncbi:MAG: dihydropteroate synthase [Lautropia sp.]|nr:dihydropteroate synthase [Lautropia sp.]